MTRDPYNVDQFESWRDCFDRRIQPEERLQRWRDLLNLMEQGTGDEPLHPSDFDLRDLADLLAAHDYWRRNYDNAEDECTELRARACVAEVCNESAQRQLDDVRLQLVGARQRAALLQATIDRLRARLARNYNHTSPQLLPLLDDPPPTTEQTP